MSEIRFEWDEIKSRENVRKHRVSFEEAETVFLDENAIRFFDPDHSQDEDRFIMLGMSFTLRVLVVCHCYREDDSSIRIISPEKPTSVSNQFTGVDHERALRFLQDEWTEESLHQAAQTAGDNAS